MDVRQIASLTQAEEVDGIYIYEIDPPRYIAGRNMGVVGMVGEFERGPVDVKTRVGDAATFLKKFGGYGTAPSGSETTWRGYSGFRSIAGKQWGGLRICRPGNTSAAAATVDIPLVTHVADPLTQGRKLTVTLKYKGLYGNAASIVIDDASDTSLTNGFKLTITVGTDTETIDNLTAGMTAAALGTRAAVLELVDLALANDGTATKAAWPATYTPSAGADGTAALQAWTDCIDLLLSDREISVIFVAEVPGDPVTDAAINAYIKGKVAPATGAGVPVIACLSGPSGDDIDDAATAVASYRSDRLLYCWPWRKQVYSAAAAIHADGLLTVPSNDVVASALAAIGPDHDVSGPEATAIINAATSGLEYDNLTRDDYVTAKSQGVCALEFDPDLGYRVRVPVVTDLTTGKELAYRRRMADYIQWSIAASLKYFAGEPITPDWEDGINGAVEGFLFDLKRLGIISDYSVDSESVNTLSNKAKGIYYVKIRVQLFGIARSIVLMSQIGATVTIEEAG